MRSWTTILILVLLLPCTMAEAQGYSRSLGKKQWETTNHLGNVVATTSDRKLAQTSGSPAVLSTYETDIVSHQDYYPYGMLLEGRAGDDGYRFGFNGMERDDEVKGEGGSYDFGARVYDGRVGRWRSVDPLRTQYPFASPYNYVHDNPILNIDPDGKRVVIFYNGEDGKRRKIVLKKVDDIELLKTIENDFLHDMYETLDYLKEEESIKKAITIRKKVKVVETNSTINEKVPSSIYSPNNYTIYYNSKEAIEGVDDSEVNELIEDRTGTGTFQTPALGFLHEIGHFLNDYNYKERKERLKRKAIYDGLYDNQEEKKVITEIENPAAQRLNINRTEEDGKESTRSNHKGIPREVSCSTCLDVKPRKSIGKNPRNM